MGQFPLTCPVAPVADYLFFNHTFSVIYEVLQGMIMRQKSIASILAYKMNWSFRDVPPIPVLLETVPSYQK